MFIINNWYKSKPLIGMIGCPPLPGSGAYTGMEREKYIDCVLQEARTLVEGGFDGMMLQNIGDLPVNKKAGAETIAWMSSLGALIRSEVKIPFGISLLEDDPEPILAVAHAVGAQFVRIKVYVGAMVGPDGVVEGVAARVQRYRRALMAQQITVFADVFDRTRMPLGNFTLEEMAHEAVWFGKAEGLVITGRNLLQSFEFYERVKTVTDVPIWIGGGVDAENIEQVMEKTDGMIVGTSIKKGGKLLEMIDLERVKKLAELRSKFSVQ
jgi:membrane complex biogenesis BtpA family protein